MCLFWMKNVLSDLVIHFLLAALIMKDINVNTCLAMLTSTYILPTCGDYLNPFYIFPCVITSLVAFDLPPVNTCGEISTLQLLGERYKSIYDMCRGHIYGMPRGLDTLFCQTSNKGRTSVGDRVVDHSDVVGPSPVGAALTTSLFST